MSRKIVITGLGTVNPLGNDVATTWSKVKNGENGIGPLTKINVKEGIFSTFSSKIAGEVRGLDMSKYAEKKEVRRMDPFIQYAMAASLQAMEDAGLKDGGYDPERISVIFGNGIGGIETLEENIVKLHNKGIDGIHPLLIPKMIINEAPGMVAIRLNAQGPSYGIVTACSSATDAIGICMDLIRKGWIDIAVTGGTEAPITPLGVGGFCVLQAVSTRNDDPEHASRPFDKDRDGFVMSEGAGIIILESEEHAKKRGAKIYCEMAGYGASCDANHITAPHPEAVGAVRAMKLAVQDAGLQLSDIDYINAHGTSTPINDPIETKAVKKLFGDHAYKLKMSSTKSMHGHLLGAAGGIEAVICAMALKEQVFPPTRNLMEKDPECDLDYVPHKAVSGTVRAAISNSLGFGGHNGVLCFRQHKG
jgi:3-oxoacyl-[acyl-carrier-protein] synthase II